MLLNYFYLQSVVKINFYSCIIIGNYTEYEETKRDKELGAARTQEYIDKQRKQLEESIQKMQIAASKSEGKTGMVASRKKKLTRCGAEKVT